MQYPVIGDFGFQLIARSTNDLIFTLWKHLSCCQPPSGPPAWSWSLQNSTPSPQWTSPLPLHRQTLESIAAWSRPGTPQRSWRKGGYGGRRLYLPHTRSPGLACCAPLSTCAGSPAFVCGSVQGGHGPCTFVDKLSVVLLSWVYIGEEYDLKKQSELIPWVVTDWRKLTNQSIYSRIWYQHEELQSPTGSLTSILFLRDPIDNCGNLFLQT